MSCVVLACNQSTWEAEAEGPGIKRPQQQSNFEAHKKKNCKTVTKHERKQKENKTQKIEYRLPLLGVGACILAERDNGLDNKEDKRNYTLYKKKLRLGKYRAG